MKVFVEPKVTNAALYLSSFNNLSHFISFSFPPVSHPTPSHLITAQLEAVIATVSGVTALLC